MMVLVLAITFALGFVYFALRNTLPIDVNLGLMTFTAVPVYLVALGSLLAGLFVGWVISFVNAAATAVTLMTKNSQIHSSQRLITDLKTRVGELETENARLRGEKPEAALNTYTHQARTGARNFFAKLRRSLSV